MVSNAIDRQADKVSEFFHLDMGGCRIALNRVSLIVSLPVSLLVF